MYLFIGSEKSSKPSLENEEKNLILIEDRDKIFRNSRLEVLILHLNLKPQKAQLIKGLNIISLFLLLLLAFLLKRPRFYFSYFFKTISLAMSEAESRVEKVVVSFFEYFLLKILINF